MGDKSVVIEDFEAYREACHDCLHQYLKKYYDGEKPSIRKFSGHAER